MKTKGITHVTIKAPWASQQGSSENQIIFHLKLNAHSQSGDNPMSLGCDL